MSLLQHAKQTRRVLTNAFKNNYGRRMPYSAFVDRLNRQPLLDSFKQRHADVPVFATREQMWSFIAEHYAGAVDYLEFGVHRGHSISISRSRIDSLKADFSASIASPVCPRIGKAITRADILIPAAGCRRRATPVFSLSPECFRTRFPDLSRGSSPATGSSSTLTAIYIPRRFIA